MNLAHFSLSSGQIFRLALQKGPKSGDCLHILASISIEGLEEKSERVGSNREEPRMQHFVVVYVIKYNMCICINRWVFCGWRDGSSVSSHVQMTENAA